ncbi:MAG: CpsB/CapC family capsule biosynthesis tyrosine phosphatase [Clostridia bacterium]|nr:CpsB/CapC family capsule biosynthesis tyrosine phosphatase [Clostridia bacterium]
MIDFHSHVLPGIDDGADSVEESLAMLRRSRDQGVSTVVATPHYFCDQTDPEAFLSARQKAYDVLKQAMKGEALPELRLGCEVHLTKKIPDLALLDQLCIEGTSCILLEMPYELWQPWLNDAVYRVIASRKLTPVIAHVDRYRPMLTHFEKIEQLLAMEVYVQLNADAFLDWRMRRIVKKLMNLDKPLVLGSDMHNMTDRQTHMQAASKKIVKRFGADALDAMEKNAAFLLKEKSALLQ